MFKFNFFKTPKQKYSLNLTQKILTECNSHKFIFDDIVNIARLLEKRGHEVSFTYTSQFHLMFFIDKKLFFHGQHSDGFYLRQKLLTLTRGENANGKKTF